MLSQDLNTKEFKYIDATPDEEYPLRILRSYRRDCDTYYSSSTTLEVDESNPLVKLLNDLQRQRAEILDRAIAVLEANDGHKNQQQPIVRGV